MGLFRVRCLLASSFRYLFPWGLLLPLLELCMTPQMCSPGQAIRIYPYLGLMWNYKSLSPSWLLKNKSLLDVAARTSGFNIAGGTLEHRAGQRGAAANSTRMEARCTRALGAQSVVILILGAPKDIACNLQLASSRVSGLAPWSHHLACMPHIFLTWLVRPRCSSSQDSCPEQDGRFGLKGPNDEV